MLGLGFNLLGGLSARGVSFIPTADQMRSMAAPFESNLEQQDGDSERGQGILAQSTPVGVRRGFVRKVYALVLSQLVLTVVVAGTTLRFVRGRWVQNNSWALGLSVALCFASLFAIMCYGAAARKFPRNYVSLYLFTTCVAISLGLISAALPQSTVVLALALTTMIFSLLTAYAWVTKTSFVGYMPYVFAAFSIVGSFGFVLCMLNWCFSISLPWLVVVYDAAGVALFTFYIVFDTQRVIGEWGGHSTQFSIDDYAYAALSLYIDIVNLFMHLLSLVRYFAEQQGRTGR